MGKSDKKVILVTGASSGIGNAAALALAHKGNIVFGTSRNPGKISNDKIHMLQMDVTDRLSVETCVKNIIDKFGCIDVLVNSAGVGISGPLEEISEDEMHWQMNVNFYGTVRVIQEVLPVMRKNKKGLVITIGSLGGRIGLPYQGMYSASKFAIDGVTEAFEKEVKPFGIKFVSVLPGDICTPFTANRVLNKKNNTKSPYYEQASKTLKVIEKDETGGMDPVNVGNVIEKIVRKRKPRHNYIVAAWDQKLALILKKFLPDPLFSWIISDHYGIK